MGVSNGVGDGIGVGDGVGVGDGLGVEVGNSPGVHSSSGASGASIGPGNGTRSVLFSSSSRPIQSSSQARFASSHVGCSDSQPSSVEEDPEVRLGRWGRLLGIG